MILGGVGGGNTKTGLIFEGKTDLADFLKSQTGYKVKEKSKDQYDIFFEDSLVAQIFQKHGLYRYLATKNVDWKNFLSKKLLPDDSIYVITNNTIHIIEKKFQRVAGSVDEKLQTCDFKKKQYQKLFFNLNVQVEYMYLLSNWFRKAEYRDVLDYIISVDCSYYFEYIPLKQLGLPIPRITK